MDVYYKRKEPKMAFHNEEILFEMKFFSTHERKISLKTIKIEGQCNSGSGNGRYTLYKVLLKENGVTTEHLHNSNANCYMGLKQLKVTRINNQALNQSGAWIKAGYTHILYLQREDEERCSIFFSE